MITIMITIASDHHGRAERTMRGLLSRTRTRSLLGIGSPDPLRLLLFSVGACNVLPVAWMCPQQVWMAASNEGGPGGLALGSL
jgi:hypothetical protein